MLVMESPIGERIRRLREAKSLSLRELGEMTGIHWTALGRKERGISRVTLSEQRAIAKAFGIEPESLTADVSRTARLPPRGIPVINRAPAGPSMAYDVDHYDEYHTAWSYLDRGDIADGAAFAVEIVERSMEPTLKHGDCLILLPVTEEFPRNEYLLPGAIVFVRFSNDTNMPGVTVARWQPGADGVIVLAKDNPASSPIIVEREAIVRLAVAVEVRRKL